MIHPRPVSRHCLLIGILGLSFLINSCDSTSGAVSDPGPSARDSIPLNGGTPTDLVGVWSFNFSNGLENIFQVDSFRSNGTFVIHKTDSLNKSYTSDWRTVGAWKVLGNKLILIELDVRYRALGTNWSDTTLNTYTVDYVSNDTFQFDISGYTLSLTASPPRNMTEFGQQLVQGTKGSAPAIGISAPIIFSTVTGNEFYMRIGSATPEAVVYFTTDGTTPNTSSKRYNSAANNGGVYLDSTATIKAIAVKNGISSDVSTKTFKVDTIAAPTYSPAGGAYDSAQLVTISCATPGATIYYTKGRNTPTTTSTIYTGPIRVENWEEINAVAVKNGFTKESFANYVIKSGQPVVFTPGAGNYFSAQTIELFSLKGEVYYTQDGSTPTISPRNIYNPERPLRLSSSTTIKAITAWTSHGVDSVSAVVSATYVFPTISTPTFSLPGGVFYTDSEKVSLGCSTPGVVIYYTTDGSIPTTASLAYKGPISLSPTEARNVIAVNAIAIKDGISSERVSATYSFSAMPPVASPPSGVYSTAQLVVLTSSAGAAIYYTTDGSIPSLASTLYSGPISVNSDKTIRAVVVKNGKMLSMTSETYVVNSSARLDSSLVGTWATALKWDTGYVAFSVTGQFKSSLNGYNIQNRGTWWTSGNRIYTYTGGKADSVNIDFSNRFDTVTYLVEGNKLTVVSNRNDTVVYIRSEKLLPLSSLFDGSRSIMNTASGLIEDALAEKPRPITRFAS